MSKGNNDQGKIVVVQIVKARRRFYNKKFGSMKKLRQRYMRVVSNSWGG